MSILKEAIPVAELMPHQVEAITGILKTLKTNNRCHVSMACGTGKTRVCIYTADLLNPKTIIVFVPTLALINQFLKEWVEYTKCVKLEILTICSDKEVTKGLQPNKRYLENIKFPVTTDAGDVTKFLNKENKNIKLLFCTYNSSTILTNKMSFDLAFFDEAHRTVGLSDKIYAYPLFDKNVNIKKRVFLTATPKYINKEKLPNFKGTHFGDDESYGPCAYNLGFRDAINLKLISDYKAVVSVVKIKKEQLDNVKIGQAELCESLIKAINKTSSKKIVTFHRTIEDSIAFQNYLKKHPYFKNTPIFNISSKMSIKDRQSTMIDFGTARVGVITNSRCLTEGVNVPSIDMVAFLYPKSSKVDILQAIGRALRKSAGKKFGYVFLPTLISENENDINEAIKNSEYSYMWDVISTLVGEDTDLKIYTKNDNVSKEDVNKMIKSKIEFLEDPGEFDFSGMFDVMVFDNFDDQWNKRFELLKLYRSEKNLLKGFYTNPHLSHWVGYNRDQYRKKELSEERIKKLESIGFLWFPNEGKWDIKYNELKYCYENNISVKKSSCALQNWTVRQRKDYKEGKLTKERIDKLKAIEFNFTGSRTIDHKGENISAIWFGNYQKAKKIYNTFGMQLKDIAIDKFDKEILRWLGNQRPNGQSVTQKKQMQLLNEIGMNWGKFRYLNRKDRNKIFK